MDHVIFYRNTQNGRLGYVTDDSGDYIAIFGNFDEAYAATKETTICKVFPFQIVPLDEL